MISIREALELVLAEVRPLGAESIPLSEADGRILAEDVRAPSDVPSFANSQMDGFGVHSQDLADAREDAPARLRVVATIAAGSPLEGVVEGGTAVRIMTGAPIPAGVDAVVPIEEAQTEGEVVVLNASCPAGRFVRGAGEDIRSGETVLQRGRALRPADAGLLASMGCAQVSVSKRPRVAILGTGDELVPLGEPLGPGQIHDSNAYTLASAVREVGGTPERLGIIRDDRASLHAALEEASRCDAVLSTGGVSVGDFDHVKDVMDEIGLQRRFWRVAQKPGKPITFATGKGCLYFGLPGNPVSATVCFALYVAPALRAALGCPDVYAPAVRVTVGEAMRTAGHLTELVRCTLRPEGLGLVARRTGSQSSGVLRSLSLADGLLISPPGHAAFAVGDQATALQIRSGIDLAAAHVFD
ncbi:MAG: molybdopterin molybdotransferase MoeA [Candidatus Binatia bacterium]|nr:molybdopterin molybdotransferase MoeA [Candidatus Binatia bacterium]